MVRHNSDFRNSVDTFLWRDKLCGEFLQPWNAKNSKSKVLVTIFKSRLKETNYKRNVKNRDNNGNIKENVSNTNRMKEMKIFLKLLLGKKLIS